MDHPVYRLLGLSRLDYASHLLIRGQLLQDVVDHLAVLRVDLEVADAQLKLLPDCHRLNYALLCPLVHVPPLPHPPPPLLPLFVIFPLFHLVNGRVMSQI